MEFVADTGVGPCEPVEEGLDQPGPVSVAGWGPAVSFAVTSLEWVCVEGKLGFSGKI